jgi:hypothetical protein
VHHAELVRRTPRIVLARAVSSEPVVQRGVARRATDFATVEVLKGSVGPAFTLAFDEGRRSGAFKDEPGADFHGHEDWRVWESMLTRQGNGSDCEMHPGFEPGATYLLFLDRPFHWRSFERIDRKDDRWLAAVRTLVASPDEVSGMALPLREYLREQEALFVGEVQQCFAEAPELTLPVEVNVLEVLLGKLGRTVIVSGDELWRGRLPCSRGLLVLGLVHRVRAPDQGDGSRFAARLLAFEERDRSRPAKLRDHLEVDFKRGDSEAVITSDAIPTLARLRQLAARRASPRANGVRRH